MHFGAVHRALEQFLEPQHAVAGVEEQGGEHFLPPSPQPLREIAAGGLRVADGVATLQRGVQQAVAQFQRPGQGATVKTVNQLLCGVHIAVVAEAFALAAKTGVDLDVLLEIMSGSAAASWMLKQLTS